MLTVTFTPEDWLVEGARRVLALVVSEERRLKVIAFIVIILIAGDFTAASLVLLDNS